ncbi:MAG TPA: DNA (cytosine-5-)-methyltransferase [Gemmatimonadetes bacterium]|nr:DNA (cytosine-5-)-methyltransferase [Gemmatimonadota bacterium]
MMPEGRVNSWSNLVLKCPGCCAKKANTAFSEEIRPVRTYHRNVEDMVRHTIHSIEDPDKRKQVVDALYQSSNKTPFVERSYLANYDVPEGHFHKDVTFLNGAPYRGEVDLFVGGSPCQSFSFVGAQRGFEDARGTLFYDFVRLVDEIRPRMFIWENVKGAYSHDSGKTWEVVSRCFDQTGYTWHHAVLNSNDYGIPQHRQRVFVIGFREGGEDFEFPEPVGLRTTMQDFLEDSVAGKYFLGTKGVDFVTWDKNHRKQYTQIDGEVMLCQKANQQFNWHGDFVFVEENEGQHRVDEKYFLSQKVERYVLASGTKGFSAKPETDLEVARPILATLFKNHRAGVDNYVTTEGRLRQLTPKECLRLMGFCDSFKQAVSDIQMYRQAGNSIVVDVLIAIMAQAIPVLAGQNTAFSNLQERANRVRELFDELPERQIQQSDLERVVAALSD